MAQSQVPNISVDDLLKVHQGGLGEALQAGLSGYTKGQELADVLQKRKMEQQKLTVEMQAKIAEAKKAQVEAAKEEKKMDLIGILAKNKPVTKETPVSRIPFGSSTAPEPAPQPTLGNVGTYSVPEDYNPSVDRTSLVGTPAPINPAPLEAQNQANVASAEKELQLLTDKGAQQSARQFETKQVNLPGSGPMIINIDKINKRVYDLQGNDITDNPAMAAAIPYFAPAAIVGTSGVYMTPRTVGVTRPAAGTQKGEGIKSIAQLTPYEANNLEKTKEDFNNDGAVKTSIAKQADYEMADSVIGIGNWVGDAAVLSVAAKGLGRDVGNLSTEEQRRYRMSPAIFSMIKTKANLWKEGTIRDEDRTAFKEAVRVMKQKNLDILNDKRQTYGKLAIQRTNSNLDPGFAVDYMYTPATMNQFAGEQKTSVSREDRMKSILERAKTSKKELPRL